MWRMGYTIQTSKKTWSDLPMNWGGCEIGGACGSQTPDGLSIPSTGRLIFTFSGNFSHAPVELRVIDTGAPANGQILAPGPASFAPTKNGHSFSFTWESPGGKRNDTCATPLRMEWRSPTGEEVRLHHSHVVVQFQELERDDRGGCS
jgi:hypothetical protein